MANYLPFNSIDHDRVYKAEDWAWYFATFIGNGVFPKPTDGLMVQAHSGMTVAVEPGFGFINGYAFRNPSEYLITVPNADGTLGRIDRIVLRWDLTNREMVLDCKQGTPSSDPTAPALVRTADIYELALADISVLRGLTTISQANITDRRTNTDLCGIVEGTVSQIDWATLTAQLNAFMSEYTEQIAADYAAYVDDIETFEGQFETDANAWMSEEQAEFEAWVETIRNILDETVAGHLQNEIEILQAQVGVPDEYDPDHIYQPGDFCIVNNVLQRCTETTLGGSFDPLFWRATSVIAELSASMDDALDALKQDMAKGSLAIVSGLLINNSGDHLIVGDSDETLAVNQTIKFNFA